MTESKCKGIVMQGPRKNMNCLKDGLDNGYCIAHQRHFEFDKFKEDGNEPCSMFFRGCNNSLTKEHVSKNIKSCNECRNKKNPKKINCAHLGCTFKIIDEKQKYCIKHIRDYLRDDAIQKHIQYCDIERGCFSILENGKNKCSKCISDIALSISKDIILLREKHKIIIKHNNLRIIFKELFEKQEENIIEVNEIWRCIQKGAINRALLFTLSLSEFEKMIVQPCYYCGFYSDIRLNGIDRINNDKGYILSNCLPCCTLCNIMKQSQVACEFLDKIDAIVTYYNSKVPISSSIVEKWKDVYLTNKKPVHYNKYRDYTINRRLIGFTITEIQYNSLTNLSCYLCGLETSKVHNNGIDRFDSDIRDYTLANSRTCCTHCNIIKGKLKYDVFIRKCLQIVSNKCDRTIFEDRLRIARNILRNEFYTANDIYEFIQNKRLDDYISWCKEKGKTIEFIADINGTIEEFNVKEKSEIILKLQNILEKERTRLSHAVDSSYKKLYHSSAIYAMMTEGETDKFKKWYETRYEPSYSFDEQFKQLTLQLQTVKRKDGIELCKQFMIQEKNRRNNQRVRDKQKKNYLKTDSKPEPIFENIIIEPVESVESVEPSKETKAKIIMKKFIEPSSPSTKPIPKQWKVKQIYEHYLEGNLQPYRDWCETTHELTNEIWGKFIDALKDKLNAEQIIHDFVLNLRKLRHNKIVEATNRANYPLERENRQQWPATSVLRAYKEDKLDLFKKFQEDYTGDMPDDVKWVGRWQGFVSSLESATDEECKKLISKFMTAQRTRVYRKKTGTL